MMSELSSSELRDENEKLNEENARLTRMLRVTEKFRTMLISVVNHCKCDVETNIRLRFNLLMQEYYDSKQCDTTDDHTRHTSPTRATPSDHNISSDDSPVEESDKSAERDDSIAKENRLLSRTVISNKSKVDSIELRERIAKMKRYVARPKAYARKKASVVSSDRRFTCSWPGCEAVYRARVDLKTHMWRHTGEKIYACEWPGCDKRFPIKRNLARHRETHEGVKHYACDWPGCEYKSWYPQGVRTHRKRHTDERPYKCNWPSCEWSFRHSTNLKVHMLKHTGEKPFSCVWPGCEHRFQSRQAMKSHFERSHK